jgi:hypothetical protein
MTGHDTDGDAMAALCGLLDAFRQGRIVSLSAEREGMERHAGALTARWDERFPGFPTDGFPYTSYRGLRRRKYRDAYLKDILVSLLADRDPSEITIVNPACTFGRHAFQLAARLPQAKIFGTDIEMRWHRLYRLVRWRHLPDNCTFARDNMFDPQLHARPTAVVFFGACGSVTDAAIDYAIGAAAPYLLCRTCCHDNIGGNTLVKKRNTNVNRFFRWKNREFRRMLRSGKWPDYYFSDKYDRSIYPRSQIGKSVSDSDEFQKLVQHSADSDICRAILDLDRYFYLIEKGYRVFYQGELFVAQRRVKDSHRESD